MPTAKRRLAPGLMALLLAAPLPAAAHGILTPALADHLLAEVADHYRESREAPTGEARAEALYRLGETARGVAEVMNQDLASHGQSDPLVAALLERLGAYQVRITYSSERERFAYDLAAFRDYLRLAPIGRRAAGARFRLIAGAFYETLGADPSKLVGTDLAGLAAAVAEEEAFLEAYPGEPRAREVRFFLAVDYYRLLKNAREPGRASTYERRARQALRQVVEQDPGTVEARAAQTLLEELER